MDASSTKAETIYTIGHSTRPADAFLTLLTAHQIRAIADVRLIPRSSRYPHFSIERLPNTLGSGGVAYHHFPDLGGRRRPKPNSVNTAWRVEAFRGYADHMLTDRFRRALERLLTFAAEQRTAVMCAEALWWQCHRRLLSDALLVRGVAVFHILSDAPAKPHELSEFARQRSNEVIYPGLL